MHSLFCICDKLRKDAPMRNTFRKDTQMRVRLRVTRRLVQAKSFHYSLSSPSVRSYLRLVRNPYQTCVEMLSVLRTHTEQLKWTSKRKKSRGKAVGKRMRGECPVAEAGAPGSGAPRILFLTALTIDILRFEVNFSCSVWVLRTDSISAHVWYGLQTNLP